ncbi:MAG: YraN family protein [Candidatus Thiodiazotropha taylori]|nr:YraN family protein [Candidatus Thiodiazotropha taylori]MCG7919042.1 YraN family protein [Candidatus Thiodiazotropha taylori]MCG7994885.1 YraN family protein [Candidatus Thiodiazotropha taylori]MCG8087833.1 YraN family protein [Candidatus Thiodiazotropha taylori]MCW4245731.1 YraN family protein [Candidatus Thiodiazotropha taylori]
MKADHLQQGEAAEQLAVDYLSRRGLKLVTRNFRCKVGEIDLVMREKRTLVFVEVRYRQSDDYGSALESITPSKQRKLLAAANLYLQKNQIDQACRFDVVAINGSANKRTTWIKDAIQS